MEELPQNGSWCFPLRRPLLAIAARDAGNETWIDARAKPWNWWCPFGNRVHSFIPYRTKCWGNLCCSLPKGPMDMTLLVLPSRPVPEVFRILVVVEFHLTHKLDWRGDLRTAQI